MLDSIDWFGKYRFYSDAKIVGSPRHPLIISANTVDSHGALLIDWFLPDRVDMVSAGEAAHSASKFCMYMADRKTWIGAPGGEIEEIAANEIVLISSDMAIRTVSDEDTRHLTLLLPRELVTRRLPWADRLCGRKLPIGSSNRDVARSIMSALRSSLVIDQFEAVSSSLIGTLLTSIDQPLQARAEAGIARPDRIDLVRRVITDQYSDPDFTAVSIAESINVSIRLLHRICHEQGSAAEMLRQHRLRVAAERLLDAAWASQSITDIAFACGFTNSSHFSTLFKQHAGVSPRDFRHDGTVRR